jgi:hypothetical protein
MNDPASVNIGHRGCYSDTSFRKLRWINLRQQLVSRQSVNERFEITAWHKFGN